MTIPLPVLSRFSNGARRAPKLVLYSAMLGVLMLAASHVAQADTINVDFDFGSPTYSGPGAAADSGTVWNSFDIAATTQTQAGLLNSTGVATGVSVTQTSDFVTDVPGGRGASGNSASNLLRDYIYTTSTPKTVTLNGLTAGTSYNLYLYGVGSDPAGFGGESRTAFTVGGVTQNTTGPIAATTNLTLGEDYVVFNNVMATNNALVITYAAPTGETRGVFNGLQLQSVTAPVPEPSTGAMMALGLGALGLIARRKRGEVQQD